MQKDYYDTLIADMEEYINDSPNCKTQRQIIDSFYNKTDISMEDVDNPLLEPFATSVALLNYWIEEPISKYIEIGDKLIDDLYKILTEKS